MAAVKFAICNELFEGREFASVCRSVAALGYTGLEIAPFTLGSSIAELGEQQRRELRGAAEQAGVTIIGLHWLLAKTTGYHLNASDEAARTRTAAYLGELTHLCADLGGTLMVFGSPAARRIEPGLSYDQAMDYAADTIGRFTSVLRDRNVTLCLEPLGPSETDFMQTAAEGDRLVDAVAHPNVRLHLDVKAMASEPRPIAETIRQHCRHLAHFHANDPNLRGPGMGDVDFAPIFKALSDVRYGGWVSVEVFDFRPNPETIARESIDYMRRQLGSGR